MSKMLNPAEIADLVKSSLVGKVAADMERDVYGRFLAAITEVLCDFHGGEARSVTFQKDDAEPWLVAVRGNSSLPEGGGIWARFDPEGELQ